MTEGLDEAVATMAPPAICGAKVRICYAVPRYLPRLGGIEVHVAALATEMVRRGHTVSVATLDDRAQALSMDGIGVRSWRARLGGLGRQGVSWAYARDLARADRNWDLVHVHNIHAVNTLGVLARLPPSMPTVLTPHFLGTGSDTGVRAMHAVYAPLVRRAARHVNKVICVSQTEAADFAAHFRILRGALQVIPNGVPDHFARADRESEGRFRLVLTASRLESYKQPQLVGRSLEFLPPEYTVSVAGTGPMERRLRDDAAAGGYRDRLQLLGRVPLDEMGSWYARASVYVSMSRRECFGLTIVEALAAGVPVVASNISAHREVFDLCGWDSQLLVPVDASPEQLATAIVQASEMHPDRRRPPTWSDVGRRTESLYEQVLADAVT